MHESIWKKTQLLPSFAPLEQDTKTDVLIIGGGLAGLLTAYMMHEAGVDYLLIEAETICSGITQNTTAKITSQHGLNYHKLLRRFGADAARLYWLANEAALEKYRAFSQHFPCELETKDSYIYTLDHPETIENEQKALQRLQIPGEVLSDLPLPFRVAGAIRFRDQAQFHPLKFAAGLVKDLNIREHTAALAYTGDAVMTNRSRIRAEKIVVATHFPLFNKHGWYFLKLYQNRSYVLALEGVPDLGGMYLDEADGGFSLRNYGDLLLLGGGNHRTGKKNAGWAALEKFAQTHFPDAQKRFQWAAQDCMSLDNVAYIGRYSKHTPNLYVATGFQKWGMSTSMVAAMVLNDLVQGRENPYADVFSPSRSMLHPQLLKNIAESSINLLTPSVPRCPHMGCALKWNRHERSWDCPCHGSRFAENGTLLDNPATGDLKRGKQA